MGKHRDRLDIVADILKIAAKSSSKTNIMHEANLSFDLLEKYLKIVTEHGLLQLTNKDYHLTATGKTFLYQNFSIKYSRDTFIIGLAIREICLLLNCVQ